MGLQSVLKSAVKVADKVTKDLQSTVTLRVWTGQDVYGNKTYTDHTGMRALVDWTSRHVQTASGQLAVSRAVITFLDIAALLAATGGSGVRDQDVIIMQDGSEGITLDISGFISPENGHPFATEVIVG